VQQIMPSEISRELAGTPSACGPVEIPVTLLTGGGDKPYAFGIAKELLSKGAIVDFIGSDDLDFPEFRGDPRLHFFNLRGDQNPNAGVGRKMARICGYYVKLLSYAVAAKPKLFHILWNNKFQYFDRTLLMLFYRFLGKKIVLTLHNVNTNKRDNIDSFLNRLTLRIQYHLADHLFVHTKKMKMELWDEFHILPSRVTVIPFGINNAVPMTSLTSLEARERLGIPSNARTLLFFGNITPYKGLEFLLEAFQQLSVQADDLWLVIAGGPKGSEDYWRTIRKKIGQEAQPGRVLVRSDFIPDEEVELYFKAADVLVLPYRHVYQSGVMFLGYSFGLPVLASDVGSLRDDVVEGQTGFVFKADDAADLKKSVQHYFSSPLYKNLDQQRDKIRTAAAAAHSWDEVGRATVKIYSGLLGLPLPAGLSHSAAPHSSIPSEISSPGNEATS
jgi:D-inositol-3-phosphate glycosyltransferase